MTRDRDRWNVVDLDGHIGRSVRGDQWWAPGVAGVELSGGGIRMTEEGFTRGEPVSGERTLLEKFAVMHERGDELLLQFAGRWGMLHVCTHGLGSGHPRINGPLAMGLPDWTVSIPENCSMQPIEPVGWWRYWSLQAWGLLSAATSLRVDQRTNAAAWDALLRTPPWIGPKDLEAFRPTLGELVARLRAGRVPLRVERDVVAMGITVWLRAANVGIEVRWESGRPDVALRVDGLLAGVAMQLALALGDVDGWGVCSGCGAFHVPRRPNARPGRRSFCEACRTAGVPVRLASREYRAKRNSRAKRSPRDG